MKTHALVVMAVCSLGISGCGAGFVARDSVNRVESGLPDALQAPLEDLNLKREDIPEVLRQAREDPYHTRGTSNCSSIRAEIALLDDALGPDTDVPRAEENVATGEQAAGAAADATLDVVRDTVTDFIPARSWIRRLTGAHQHSEEVQSSIRAGQQRRGFLKGMAQQRGCRS